MANSRQFNIELILQGLEKLREFENLADKTDKNFKNVAKHIANVQRQIEELGRSTSSFNKILAEHIAPDAKKKPTVRSISQEIAQGSPQAQLRNAGLRKEINEFRATSQQLFASLTNTYIKGLRDFTRAVEQEGILQMAGLRQSVPSMDRATLKNQIEAQRYRVAEASQNPHFQHNLPNVRKGAQNKLDAEKRTLLELEAAYNRILEDERQLKRDTQARVNLQDRIRQSKDDMLRPLQRELEALQAINKEEALRDPSLRKHTDNLDRTKKVVGLERRIGYQNDPEIRSLADQEAAHRRLKTIEDKRKFNREVMRSLTGKENELARVKLRMQDRMLQLEAAQLKATDGNTAEVDKQVRRLSELHKVKDGIISKNRLERRLEQQSTEEIIRKRTAQQALNEEVLKDPRYREKADSLARSLKKVGLERSLAYQTDPELRSLQERARVERDLTQLRLQRQKLVGNADVYRGEEDKLERLKVRILNRQLQLREELLRNGSKTTAEVERHIERLREMKRQKREIIRQTREQRQAEIRTTDAIIKRRSEQALADMEALSDPGLRFRTDALARARKVVGLERQESYRNDPEIKALEERRRFQQFDEKYAEKRNANMVRMRRLQGEGNELDRVKLRIKDRELQLERAVRLSNGEVTQEVQRQLQRLWELDGVKARLLGKTKSQATAERQTTEEIVRRRTEQNRSMARDRDFLQSSAELARGQTMMRTMGDGGASLLMIQAQLMGNYMIMNKLFQLFNFGTQFVLQLDAAFHQLQAITATTTTEMGGLAEKLISVSETTKFTAVEVAEAAVTLGQAGFSTKQIEASIEAVTLLATATGTDLSQAVDLATSTLSVFNMRASEMGDVANIITAAVNESKLTVDKLALGIQYAGNTAAEMNVTLSEFSAVLGAMANSGIRAGSTLGTGLRQLLVAFNDPSEQLTQKMKVLGLTMEDINVKTQGLSGVLKNLQRAGFTSADAMQVLEVRAGAAYAAVANNINAIDSLQSAFLMSNAAAEANAVQMESLANKLAQAASVLGTFINDLFGPVTAGLKLLLTGFISVLQVLREFTPVLQLVGTAITGMALQAVYSRLVKMAGGIKDATAAMKGLGTATAVTATRLTTMGTAMRAVSAVFSRSNIVGFIVSVAAGFTYLWTEGQKSTDVLDQMAAKTDEYNGRVNETDETLTSLNHEIDRLIDQSETLNKDQNALSRTALELTQKFADLGGQFDISGGNVESFIATLHDLHDAMLKIKYADLSDAISARVLEIAEIGKAATEMPKIYDAEAAFAGIGIGQGLGTDVFIPLQRAVLTLAERVNRRQTNAGKSLQDPNLDAEDVGETFADLRTLRGGVENMRKDALLGRGAFANIDERVRKDVALYLENYVMKAADAYIAQVGLMAGKLRQNEYDHRRRETALYDSDRYNVQASKPKIEEHHSWRTENRQVLEKMKDPRDMEPILQTARERLEQLLIMDREAKAWLEENYPDADYAMSETGKMFDREIGGYQTFIKKYVDQFTHLQNVLDESTLKMNEKRIERLKKSITNPKPVHPNADPVIRRAIQAASEDTGISLPYLMNTAFLESSLRADPPSTGTTGARGLFQFVPKTWNALMDKHGERYGYTQKGEERLALRMDPVASARMAAELALENFQGLRRGLGRDDISSTDLHMAHFLGLGDAIKFLKALAENPQAIAARVVPDAAATNKNVFFEKDGRGRTVAEIFAHYNRQMSVDNSIGDLQETKRQALQAFDEMTEILTRKEKERLEKEGLMRREYDKEVYEKRGQQAFDEFEMSRAEEREKLERTFDDMVYKYDKAGDNVAQALERFAKQVADIMDRMNDARYYNQNQVRSIQTELSAMDLPQHRNRYGSVQRRAMQEELAAAQTEALGYDQLTLAATAKELEGQYAAMQKERERLELIVAQATAIMQTHRSGVEKGTPNPEYDAAVKRIKDTQEQLNTVNRDGLSIEKQIRTVRRQQAEVTLELSMRTGEALRATDDFYVTLGNAYHQWMEDQGLLMESNVRLGEKMGGVFTEIKDSWTTAAKDMVTGTKSVGDAFQDMSVRIIEALLDIALQEAATGMFGFLKGLMPGTASVGPTVGDAAAVNIPGGGMKEGGFVRAAAGKHITTRDAIPALLMDGEYVLRKSAVDTIGRETLDQINALGNRTISRGGAPAMPSKPEGDKVVNVYVVPPEQKPVPTKNDVVLWINEDMVNGGATKKLIKSINMGTL